MNQWKSYTYGLKKDGHTRPIMMLDKGASKVYMFATAPESGGSIYMKSAPLSSISFPAGRGTAVMTDGTGGTEDDINNATSTKQGVDSSTGLVVLATNDTTRRYWHAYLPLGGGSDGGPTASFTASPTSGQAPLTVQFTDTSTGNPASWSWDFGDNSSLSTAQNPSHTYSAAGTYTVKQTVSNANGSSTATGTITVTSGGGGGGGGGTLTFTPTADARVSSAEPSRNFGNSTELRARASGPELISYLKFTVTGLSGPATVKLRLYVTDTSSDGGTAFAVSNTTWTETGITYGNRPGIGTTALGRTSATTANTTVEMNLGTIPGNGTYSWAIKSASTDTVRYASRETSNKPQLVVTPT
jgi:PKD repeat protein